MERVKYCSTCALFHSNCNVRCPTNCPEFTTPHYSLQITWVIAIWPTTDCMSIGHKYLNWFYFVKVISVNQIFFFRVVSSWLNIPATYWSTSDTLILRLCSVPVLHFKHSLPFCEILICFTFECFESVKKESHCVISMMNEERGMWNNASLRILLLRVLSEPVDS
jgi:hypothetical protein